MSRAQIEITGYGQHGGIISAQGQFWNVQLHAALFGQGHHCRAQAAVAGHSAGYHQSLGSGFSEGCAGLGHKHITHRLLKGSAQIIGSLAGKGYLTRGDDGYSLTAKAQSFLAIDAKPAIPGS